MVFPPHAILIITENTAPEARVSEIERECKMQMEFEKAFA